MNKCIVILLLIFPGMSVSKSFIGSIESEINKLESSLGLVDLGNKNDSKAEKAMGSLAKTIQKTDDENFQYEFNKQLTEYSENVNEYNTKLEEKKVELNKISAELKELAGPENKIKMQDRKEYRETAHKYNELYKEYIDFSKKELKELESAKKEMETLKIGHMKERRRFLGAMGVYADTLFQFDLKAERRNVYNFSKFKPDSIKTKPFVIAKADSLPIRDQGTRPTCSAFASVRGIEILAAQKGHNLDLSEDYFYWSALENCKKSRNYCLDRGSTLFDGLLFSKSMSSSNIPSESDCPYQKELGPMASSCQNGQAKVKDFRYVENVDQIIDRLNNNKPIIAGFKLSDNFFKTKGLVGNTFAMQATGAHSTGHAVLIIGHMPLPKNLHQTEGRYCLITANSWGEKWGASGHSCLTEKWLNRWQLGAAFISIEEI